MINNTTVKKKRLFCALIVTVLIASLFACWVSAAGNEDGADGSDSQAENVSEKIAEQSDITVKSAEYDEKTGIITVTLANKTNTDKAVYGQLYIDGNEVTYTKSSIYGEYESKSEWGNIIKAGKSVELTYEYEKNLKNTPKFDINGYFFDYNETKGEFSSVNSGITEEDVTEFVLEDVLASKEVTETEAIVNFFNQMGFVRLFTSDWKCLIMIGISCVLLFLAIVKGFEPLLLVPIAFGMLLTNLPGADMFHEELWAGGHANWNLFDASETITPGLLDYLYLGVKLGIYPCLIFFGVGAMTDFEPLIANPKSLLLGAAAQLGIFVTFVAAKYLGFNFMEASSIGIIGGADGPTAIFVTSKLAPHLLGPIAVAAYSYMALVPVIQPPIMKALTTKKERCIKMQALRKVSKTEKILFPIVVTIFVALLVPSAAPLVGALMLGNLFKESGVTERLSKTVQNELMNIVTIFLGTTVGATATANTFLKAETLKILAMGVIAFGLGTAGGVLLAKFMNLFMKNKINPLIGSAGVSAVPMAARVSQVVGQKDDPSNFLLMHAMGPNVAGVIGSAIAAGVLIALFG